MMNLLFPAPDRRTHLQSQRTLSVVWLLATLMVSLCRRGSALASTSPAVPPAKVTPPAKAALPTKLDSSPTPRPEVKALIDQSDADADTMNYDHWLGLLNQAMEKAHTLNDKVGEAIVTDNFGVYYASMEQTQKAMEQYQAALKLEQSLSDQRDMAITLTNIGLLQADLSQSTEALRSLERALKLYDTVDNPEEKARTLGSIGYAYGIVHQPQAIDWYKKALQLQRKIGDHRGEGEMLSNIGLALYEANRNAEAQSYLEQSLIIRRNRQDKGGESTTLNNLGLVALGLNNPERALAYFDQALDIERGRGDLKQQATTLGNKGWIYSGAFPQFLDPKHGLEILKEALALQERFADQPGQISTLRTMAVAARKLGDLSDAVEYFHRALDIVENVRTSLGGMTDAKLSFLEHYNWLYKMYIDALLDDNKPDQAFEWAQKIKARSLLDLMDSTMDLRRGMDASDKKRADELQQHLTQINQRLMGHLLQQDADPTHEADLREQMTNAETQLQNFSDELAVKYPDLARQQSTQTITLDEVAKFLPPDTALLEYLDLDQVSPQPTVLFCVTNEGGKAVVKAYSIAPPIATLKDTVNEFRDACSDRYGDYEDSAHALYQVLVAPAAAQLAGKKHLVVCPDGVLWGMPFQALMLHDEAQDTNQFLIDRYEISYAYSATELGAAHQLAARNRDAHPSGTLLLYSNPSFGGAERFLKTTPKGKPGKTLPGGLNMATIPALTSQVQTTALKALFPKAAVFQGSAAQESSVKSQAPNFKYLHFETHGYYNDTSPMMSGIVMAEPTPNSREDGFLTAREIFDMHLKADMVVLSACETARGQARNGEGLIGLTWAVFAAGVPSQVVGQWPMEVGATSQLLKGFYRNLRAGQSKSAALRAAMISLKRDPRMSHPAAWAPCILVGEWQLSP